MHRLVNVSSALLIFVAVSKMVLHFRMVYVYWRMSYRGQVSLGTGRIPLICMMRGKCWIDIGLAKQIYGKSMTRCWGEIWNSEIRDWVGHRP